MSATLGIESVAGCAFRGGAGGGRMAFTVTVTERMAESACSATGTGAAE